MGRGTGFWEFAQFQKLSEGLVELALIVGFEAKLPGEGAGVFGQSEKSRGEGGSGEWMIAASAGCRLSQGGGLSFPRAQQTPAGEDHRLDERCFGGIAGLKLEDEFLGELVVAAQGFALDGASELGGGGLKPAKRCVL